MNINPNLRGKELLLAAIKEIEANPEIWDQSVAWHEGDKHCLGGICQLLIGKTRAIETCQDITKALGLDEKSLNYLVTHERTLEEIKNFTNNLP